MSEAGGPRRHGLILRPRGGLYTGCERGDGFYSHYK